MTTDIALILTIVVAALALLSIEELHVDLFALPALLSVGLFRLADPEEVFDDFADAAVITARAIYVVSGAPFRTGAVDAMDVDISFALRAAARALPDGEQVRRTKGLSRALM